MGTGIQLFDESEFARLYRSPANGDGWVDVQQYRRLQEYVDDNPNTTISGAARAVDIPRSRARLWLGDSRPNAVRGLDSAREHNWLPLTFDSPMVRPLTVLLSGIFSGGWVAHDYVPSFTVDVNERGVNKQIAEALHEAGAGLEVSPRQEGHVDIRKPARDTGVLGRVLVCLGAPVGKKFEGDVQFPTWLFDAPSDVREAFADLYVRNRGVIQDGVLCIREKRPDAYHESLAAYLSAVSGERVTVSESGTVMCSVDATKVLGATFEDVSA
ncbi:hypothetical protein [Haloprofundus sp. MHR1]|uniref:hypothetical protein n=1 Tax=Haloprofundus sp. MHR1 TaxID=2572921 RepID=UPI0010BE4A2D|nr:hypothetical protein [Haloprofundus sp. MHR1]QCJ45988.1 hypothetical protein FCF25_02120 [Haloprofundus sp. MHR1]